MEFEKLNLDSLDEDLLREAADRLAEERGAQLLAELENLPELYDEMGQPIGPSKSFDDRVLAMIRGYELGLAKAAQNAAPSNVVHLPTAKPARRSFRRVAVVAAIMLAVTASLVLSVQGVRESLFGLFMWAAGDFSAVTTGVVDTQVSDYDLSELPAGYDRIFVPTKLPNNYKDKTVEFLDSVDFAVRLTYFGLDGGQLVIEEYHNSRHRFIVGAEEKDAPRTSIGGYEAIVYTQGGKCRIYLFVDDYTIWLKSDDVDEAALRRVAESMRPLYRGEDPANV